MKKIINFIIAGLIMVASWSFASIAFADLNADYTYYPYYNQQFSPSHPDYYDGNLRLQLKNRADIERATISNIHYDQYSGDYYTCNWQYNQNLGTWVCNKQYAGSSIQKIQICPFGYIFNYTKRTCDAVTAPAYAHLNTSGDGWTCNAGYSLNYLKTGCVKYCKEEACLFSTIFQSDTSLPSSLPSTGSAFAVLFSGISGFCGYLFVRRKN